MRNLNNLYKSILCLAFILSFASCAKDYLNKKPLDQFSSEDVWGDPALTEAFVNKIYGDIGWGWDFNAGTVDESRSRQEASFDIGNCLVTPDNANNWGNWNGNYADIRACNIFLDKVSEMTFDKALVDRMTGEVTFLRAWDYHNLVSYFGGVPLVTKVYGLNDDFNIERSSYEDCINFIVSECDKAAALLPDVETGDNLGRATKGAALALKARTLLYAASDQHNPTKNQFLTNGFSNPELLGYKTDDKINRWTAAKNAAKAVMDMNLYGLYQAVPAPGSSPADNYASIFTSKLPTQEDIFIRFFNAAIGKGVNGWDVTPNGWYGNGGVGAVNELVDSYEMSDGTKFSRDNAAQAKEPYKNRDPRFYGTILYEGAKWRPRPKDLQSLDPVGVFQTGTWEKWENGQKVNVYGLDSRNSVANSWNNNTSGATMKKYIDPNVDIQVTYQDLTFRYFRYGEILLNYAEACIELGQYEEAKTYMNMIRTRAGMPNIPASETGDALRQRLRNERRVELAYEGHRFFDVRRWLIADQAYHTMHGVSVLYPLNPDHTTATIPQITPIEIQLGAWLDKCYFFPIARSEVNKNNKLVQNPGY
ncbi:RagB/SusD family nutrient uptake outer membrane protein [Danxiaibacter flavus]|uniref:RagB/SusD family nutrient uptake outer membrane protein n=1 Tax=Danxiaibacter flavus TaxID=3049108 RepID=A0ABV3ZIB3_9BACT|nr:RagB/SusD family nutrient uptake outer membrane protein [Chitinophagaceae bacterium DXS]